jgi:tetratricopeptide (TPR) repeat protein
MRRPVVALPILLLCLTATLRAQCPDGTPPPCAASRSPVARPLDERNWLVLPFDNITHDPSLDVVRDASVTLLYSAMSQWTDIRVVDDTRVTDLMRGVPAGTKLGQEAGFDLARRVGAGKLVMGTLLKEGARTRVQAAVFDVRTGRRLRSPSAVMVGTDSLAAVFAALAEQVLAVPAPPRVRASEVGTQNSEALHAYVAGLEAERRWEADTAVMQFRRAVALDSAFGLAHYHIYWNINQALGALPDFNAAAQDRALQAALRFSAGMPRRERTQVAVLAAAGRGDWGIACADVDRMLATDSLDAWAFYMRGRCHWELLANDTGTVLARFRSDNAALADWRRSAELDPTFLSPVRLAFDALWGWQRGECVHARTSPCPDAEHYVSAMLLDHDTLVYRPYLWATARHRWAQEPGQFAAYRRRNELARDLVATFVAANPRNWLGHWALADLQKNLGNLDAALAEFNVSGSGSRFIGYRRIYYLERFEIALQRERPEAAAAYLDSIFADPTAGLQPWAGSVFARYSLDAVATHRPNDTLIALREALLPLWAGILPADVGHLAERYGEAYGRGVSRDARVQEQIHSGIVHQVNLLAFRMRRTRPAADTADPHPIVRSQAWFALGDTAQSRRELALAEVEIDQRPPWAWDDGSWLFTAEGHLLLGDSAAALRRLRDLAARWPTMASNVGQLLGELGYLGNAGARATGREWLLYGDLAAAAGDVEQARRAYRFVVGLWEGGEAPVQPLVARARAALVKLGT